MSSDSSGGAPGQDLEVLAREGRESDRLRLANDPSTPDSVILILLDDKSFLVREKATKQARTRGFTPGGQGTSRPGDSSGSDKDGPLVERALRAASGLETANVLVYVLSLVGALIFVILGFQTTCLDGGATCPPSLESRNTILIAVGAAMGISATWIFLLGRAVAAGVSLLGHLAKTGNVAVNETGATP